MEDLSCLTLPTKTKSLVLSWSPSTILLTPLFITSTNSYFVLERCYVSSWLFSSFLLLDLPFKVVDRFLRDLKLLSHLRTSTGGVKRWCILRFPLKACRKIKSGTDKFLSCRFSMIIWRSNPKSKKLLTFTGVVCPGGH